MKFNLYIFDFSKSTMHNTWEIKNIGSSLTSWEVQKLWSTDKFTCEINKKFIYVVWRSLQKICNDKKFTPEISRKFTYVSRKFRKNGPSKKFTCKKKWKFTYVSREVQEKYAPSRSSFWKKNRKFTYVLRGSSSTFWGSSEVVQE